MIHIHILQEVPLLPYNTFGVAATATEFVESDRADELSDFLRSVPDPSSIVILGGGSNVLLLSNRYNVVVHPVMKGIGLIDETGDSVLVRAEAGEVWDDLVAWCVAENYAGIENLSHIPGHVGACPIQNIGAYGMEAKDVIESVETIEIASGQTVVFNNEQCQFVYRDSFFKKNKNKYLITAVQFRLSKTFEPDVKYADLKTELSRATDITLDTVRQAVILIRSRKLPDPSEVGNVGSFFKNPTVSAEQAAEISRHHPQAPLFPVSQDIWKISAAWLIQQCGWKGIQDGHTGTHERQPLVIVNYGDATGKEIFDFAGKIIDSVHRQFGIRMEPEVNIL